MKEEYQEFRNNVKRLKDKIELLNGTEKEVAKLELKQLQAEFDADWVALNTRFQNRLSKVEEKITKAL